MAKWHRCFLKHGLITQLPKMGKKEITYFATMKETFFIFPSTNTIKMSAYLHICLSSEKQKNSKQEIEYFSKTSLIKFYNYFTLLISRDLQCYRPTVISGKV